MIHKIYADNKQFKEVTFKKGLNIILGVKENKSNINDTRNGVGKTTLIQIIHFCLGSKLDKNSYLKKINKIKNWTFSIEIDIFGEKIRASRSIANSNIILIKGNIDNFPLSPKKDENNVFYSLNDWKILLELGLFNFKDDNKFTPTFGSLINYFIRKKPEAYINPFKHSDSQLEWDKQVNSSFLIGLNWECAKHAQLIRKNKTDVDRELRNIKETFPSKGEMEAEKLNLEENYKDKEKLLSEYKVHNEYKEVQKSANSLSKEFNSLTNENMILRRKLDSYQDAIKNESQASMNNLDDLYEKIGLFFKEDSKKDLRTARKFHNKVIENRKNFLTVEIRELTDRINKNEQKLGDLDTKRSELLKILDTHKALDDFKILQDQLLKMKSSIDEVDKNIKKYNDIDDEKTKIKESKLLLSEKIRREYEVNRPFWEKSLKIFSKNSLELYKEPGSLIINTSDKGYSFDIDFPKSDSRGISKMKIFCYDWMLVESNLSKFNMDFLIHDSEIFDGVDSRQIALALELSKRKSEQLNTQYICTLNSDTIPNDYLSDDFNLKDYIALELIDNNSFGKLLGFEF
ncbi:DUF2326 domain-containing protein [Methanobrevibacter filiformis]|uniref:DUF2326 domain-containing protein n=1 Tax=Methanobrevibacter filiformis TaxID=55758 RepID=A0A166C643_9EURY|nr:DUF2326 domain-containing protein [Methanobrevibacter filiformis]KZX11547.1 hypothetical protein MBFIL_14230 [Methanobrevibacter filiformis]